MTVAVEAYPQLQASGGFRDLQAQLATIEDAIQNSRRYYNAVVRDFNTAISTIPSNLVAGPMGYRELEFFEASAGEGEVAKSSFFLPYPFSFFRFQVSLSRFFFLGCCGLLRLPAPLWVWV